MSSLKYFVPGNIGAGRQAAALFATRLGGVSGTLGDTVHSLNLGSFNGKYDGPANVRKNFEIIARELGFPVNNIIYAHQKHTANILVADADFLAETAGRSLPLPDSCVYDAMVTDVPGAVLTARSADCAPILFYDGVKRAIGAAHCGWRGTLQELQLKTARKMRELYGSDLRRLKAAVGPCISRCCYEVSGDVYGAFANALGDEIKQFFDAKPAGKYMCDLKAINKFLLARELCADNIEISGHCTCCEPELFYSHRRDGEHRGAHAAFIALK